MANEYLKEFTQQKYEAGFVTDIETEIIEAGLNEDIIRQISAKKDEPEWLLDFRLTAFRYWQSLETPEWAHVNLPEIDYQAISYYADPTKKKDGPKEIDPELMKTFDKLGIPLTINLNAAHGKLKETAEGIIDLRSYTNELVDTDFTFEGLDMDIPSPADAVPSLTGILKTGGGVKVSKNKDVVINANMEIMKSVLTVQKFEPAFVFEIYQNILSDIKKINIKTTLTINKGERFSLDVDTDVDNQIAAALKKEFARQVEKVKAELLKQGQKWLDEQKETYKKEIDTFMSSANKAKKLLNDVKNYEKILDKKKAEAEKRIKDIAAGKIKEAQNEVKKEAENKVKDLLKGFGF